MRHLLGILLLVGAFAVGAQVEPPEPLPLQDVDLDVMQGGLAWLVGDHVKARRHFRTAAQRGHPLGHYNLAMMLLHHEGGPGDAAEGMALLRKAADGNIALAREALEQIRIGGMPARGNERPLAGPTAEQARSSKVAGPTSPAPAR